MDASLIEFGMTPSAFAEEYFERAPFLRKAALRGEPFRWSELDELLHGIEPRTPVFQLFNEGLLPEDQYTDQSIEFGAPRRRLNKVRFYGQLRGGATLVINRLENHTLRAKRLCAEVARFAGRQSMGNAYLSLRGRGTFGKHWDTHDVFAIQLLGRKRWQVFAPTLTLPLGMQTSERSGMPCPATPVLDCVLDSGDMLYVPRGWWHQAIPLDEASLHLSVGTYGPTVHDYLMWACASRMLDLAGVRQSMTGAVGREDLATVVESLREIVLDETCRSEFERQARSSERLISEFNMELFFGAGQDGLKGATVSLNSCRAPVLEHGELRVNGARLRLNPVCLAVVAVLAAASSLPIEVLCERLAHERPEAVQLAVLDLAQHEIVTIEQRSRDAAASAATITPA
jgi:ribosomal protein L16 Arg81 hydroxylase